MSTQVRDDLVLTPQGGRSGSEHRRRIIGFVEHVEVIADKLLAALLITLGSPQVKHGIRQRRCRHDCLRREQDHKQTREKQERFLSGFESHLGRLLSSEWEETVTLCAAFYAC